MKNLILFVSFLSLANMPASAIIVKNESDLPSVKVQFELAPLSISVSNKSGNNTYNSVAKILVIKWIDPTRGQVATCRTSQLNPSELSNDKQVIVLKTENPGAKPLKKYTCEIRPK